MTLQQTDRLAMAGEPYLSEEVRLKRCKPRPCFLPANAIRASGHVTELVGAAATAPAYTWLPTSPPPSLSLPSSSFSPETPTHIAHLASLPPPYTHITSLSSHPPAPRNGVLSPTPAAEATSLNTSPLSGVTHPTVRDLRHTIHHGDSRPSRRQQCRT